jgi:hypothetical protein
MTYARQRKHRCGGRTLCTFYPMNHSLSGSQNHQDPMYICRHVCSFAAALSLLAPTLAKAQSSALPPGREPALESSESAQADNNPVHKWGIEAEAIQPFLPTVNIFRIRGARSLWGTPVGLRGDLLLGAYLRPGIKHDVLNYIHEYQVSVGYRQYLWRGLHAEAGLDVGAAWGTNRFDSKRYTTATLFLNANVGYRFGFFEPGGFFENKKSSVGVYAIPQFGVYAGLGVADIGPRNGKPDVFLQGNLVLGVSF